MAQINHNVTVTETVGAFPQYKWLAHCQGCGFEARGAKPLNLTGSVMTHLTNQGTPQNVADFTQAVKDATTKSDQEDQEQKAAQDKADADAKKAQEEADTAAGKPGVPTPVANPTAVPPDSPSTNQPPAQPTAEADQLPSGKETKPLVQEGHKPSSRRWGGD